MPNTHYQNTAAGLAAAQAAPRCSHVKLNGDRCGGAALKGRPLCRFHIQAFRSGKNLPFVEDAAGIQLALMKIVRGIETGSLNFKAASLMLYALQIATSNMKRLETLLAYDASADVEQREQSLAEELLTRLDDQAFMAGFKPDPAWAEDLEKYAYLNDPSLPRPTPIGFPAVSQSPTEKPETRNQKPAAANEKPWP
jgi:hypothetical protein